MIKQSDRSFVTAQLRHIGCSERETEIYLHIVSVGSSSVLEIARGLKQHRVTVHSAVEQLIKKGLLHETRKGKKRLIGAEDPSVLLNILQQKENELHVQKAQFEYVVDILSSIQPADSSRPTVSFYEGVEGFKKMLEATLTAKGEVLVFTYVELFSQLLNPDYLEDYFKRRAAKSISTRLIFPPCDFANRVSRHSEEYRIQVRTLPKSYEWKSGIFSWNDTVSIQSFTEGKLTCTILENKDIAQFYRDIIFELSWKQAKELQEKKT